MNNERIQEVINLCLSLRYAANNYRDTINRSTVFLTLEERKKCEAERETANIEYERYLQEFKRLDLIEMIDVVEYYEKRIQSLQAQLYRLQNGDK